MPALLKVARKTAVNLVAFAKGGCPPMQVNQNHGLLCIKSNDNALAYVKQMVARSLPFKVILGANWYDYLQVQQDPSFADQEYPNDPNHAAYLQKMSALSATGIPRLMNTLGQIRADVAVVGEVLRVPENPFPCPQGEDLYNCTMPRRTAIPDEGDTRQYLIDQMSALAGKPDLIDVNQQVCGLSTCAPDDRGRNIFYDDLHLNAIYTGTLWQYFAGTSPTVNHIRGKS